MREIEEILDKYPFDRVRQHMLDSGHKWTNFDRGTFETPTIADLKKEARKLLEEVSVSLHPSSTCGTGGFTADKFTWEDRTMYRLSFGVSPLVSSAVTPNVEPIPKYIRLLVAAASKLPEADAREILQYIRKEGYGREIK